MADQIEPERTNAKTPAGGVYFLSYFLNADGRPCNRADAVTVEIKEFDKNDKMLRRTYGRMNAAA